MNRRKTKKCRRKVFGAGEWPRFGKSDEVGGDVGIPGGGPARESS